MGKKDHSRDPGYTPAHRAHGDHPSYDPEFLASKILEEGAEDLLSKAHEKNPDVDVLEDPSDYVIGAEPDSVANRVIKEAAKSLASKASKAHEGGVPHASLAAAVQKVYQVKDDHSQKSTPEYQAAVRVRQRIRDAYEREGRGESTFRGLVPELSRGHLPGGEKERHARKHGHPIVSEE